MPITTPEDISGLRDWIRAADQGYSNGDYAISLTPSSVLMAAVPWNAEIAPVAPIFRTAGPGGRAYLSTINNQGQVEDNNWLWSDGPDGSKAFPSHCDTRTAWTQFLLFRLNDLRHSTHRDAGEASDMMRIFYSRDVFNPMIGAYQKSGTIPTVLVTNVPEFGSSSSPDRVEFAVALGQWYFLVVGLDAATTLRARMASVSVCRQGTTPTSASYNFASYGRGFGPAFTLGSHGGLITTGHDDDVDVAELGTYGSWIGDSAVQDLFDYVQDFYGLVFAGCGARRRMFAQVIG